MLRTIFFLNLFLVGLFYLPGWLLLRLLSFGRYPPPRGEPHSEELVALAGILATLVVATLALLA